MSTISDGKSATLAVRNYFEDTYGPLNAFGFEVDDVRYLTSEKAWLVEIRFWQALGAMGKTPYKVKIAEDGRILEVTKKSVMR